MQRSMVGWVCCLVLLAGCSGGDNYKSKRPKTVPAKGVVTYRGQPVGGAIILFVPLENSGTAASAMTDDSGGFTMMAFPPDSGAVPGKYTATVMKTIEPPAQVWSETSHDAPPPKVVKAVSLIPAKYAERSTSGLSVTIPEAGDEALKFELKD